MSQRAERRILRIIEETYVQDMYVPRVRTSFSPEFHRNFRMLVPEFDGQTGQILAADEGLVPFLAEISDESTVRERLEKSLAVLM